MSRKIIMCAPLPPPNGGITNWYLVVEAEAQKRGYRFVNINTSPRTKESKRGIFYRVFVQGVLMLHSRAQAGRAIKENPDIRVSHVTTSGSLAFIRDKLLLSLFRKKNVKTVYHIHFGRIPDICEKRGWEYKLMRRAMKFADSVIAIDPKTYETLVNEYGEKKVVYLPNPVPMVSFEPSRGSKTVMFLGSVCKAKGVEELLLAWVNIRKEYPDWQLNIVGGYDQEYKTYLDRNYASDGVFFTGYVQHDEAIQLLSQSAFLVLPSYTEGFPNVVIEAMMCSKAVIGTDVGAIADILSGGCGVVISPQHVDEIQGSIEMLIANEELRQAMGERGRKKALSLYNSHVVFDQYVQLWEYLTKST